MSCDHCPDHNRLSRSVATLLDDRLIRDIYALNTDG
jgi:hypothetical protein